MGAKRRTERRTEQQIQDALLLAEATSLREASRQTGIPLTTIHRRLRAVHGTPVSPGTSSKGEPERRPGKKLKEMAEEVQAQAVARAVEIVTQTLTERLGKLSERLYDLAEDAANKVATAIADAGEAPAGKTAEPHNQAGSAWVRALVGVFAQSLEKAQLLTGKPTVREEVMSGEHARELFTRKMDELAAKRLERGTSGGDLCDVE